MRKVKCRKDPNITFRGEKVVFDMKKSTQHMINS